MNRRQSVTTAVAVVVMVLGLTLVERVGATYRDGLDVTADAAQVTVAGITSAQSLATEVAELATTTAVVIDQLGDALRDAAATSTEVGDALRSNVAEGIVGTSGVADDLAQFIEFLERLIPGNRDSLAEDLRRVADGLEPLPDQLRRLGDDLTSTAERLDTAAPAIDAAAGQLADVALRLADAGDALQAAQALAVELADRADNAQQRADGDVWIARALVVLVVGSSWLAVVTSDARRRQWVSEAT